MASPDSDDLASGPTMSLPAAGRPAAGERFRSGTLLDGRYRLVSVLGRGGMGEVYRADDLKLGQSVALKFLPEAVADDAGRLRRLLDEVRIARQVSHPNVCRVYDIVESEGLHFIAMEDVDGEDLASLLKRVGHLSPKKAFELGLELCAGLAAMHERGVLHRDLKPANVMVDRAGRVRITDFGLAGATGGVAWGGTPAYMAPEQQAGEALNAAADLYSLGMVLCELFTGERPKMPADLRASLDPAIERILRRCLAEDPSERPSSVQEVKVVLAAARTGSVAVARVWNVPFERNPFFTGREDELAGLRETLTRHGAAAICGLGGIGKTQTAVEYAYRYRERYDFVFWVTAETVDDLETGYAEVARWLDLPEKGAQERQVSVQAVLRWLESNASWLLILDNADTFKVLKGRFPAQVQGHVLLTSRAQSLKRLARPLRIKALLPAQAEDFLLRRAYRDEAVSDERAAVAELAEELGCLPLALEQAGAYVEETGTAFRTYLSGFRSRRLQLLSEETAPEEHPPVTTTWEMNFAEIEKTSAASADLLRASAFLAPAAIPVELIVERAPEWGPALAAVLEDALEDELVVDELLRPLRRYSLVQRDVESRTFSVHRLVQEAVKARMDEEMRRLWAGRVVQAVARALPEKKYSLPFEQWGPVGRLFPHGQAASKLVDEWRFASTEASQLLHKLGIYSRSRGLYEEAESWSRKALKMRRSQPAVEPLCVVESLLTLGRILTERGSYEEAESIGREALALAGSCLADEPLVVADCQSQLGLVSYMKSAFDEADQLFRDALTTFRRELGDAHPAVSECSIQLGLNSYTHGAALEDSERRLRQVLEVENARCPMQPMLRSSAQRVLSWFLALKGAYEEAEELAREALATIRQLAEKHHIGDHGDLGGGHISPVSMSMLFLAMVLRWRGSLVESEELFREALARFRRQHGAQHPFLPRYMMPLAHAILVRKGADEEVEELTQQALEMQRREFGDMNTIMTEGLRCLALVRLAQNRDVEAESILHKSLGIQRRIFPADSIWIAVTENLLGTALVRQARFDEAEPLLVRSRTLLEDKLGDGSRLTRMAGKNLAELYEAWDAASPRHKGKKLPSERF